MRLKSVIAVGVMLCVLVLIAAIVGLNWYRTGVMHSRCVSIAWGAALIGLLFVWMHEEDE
jgi:hypothetical protein